MKLSEAWLREWVNPKVSTTQLMEQLTMAGLEVDSCEPAAPGFSGIVIAEVLEVNPHPDADRLRITKVEVGESEPLTIVTNVADIAVGEKVALAKVGATMPDGSKLKKAKLRGVESFGMFCSMGTLGLVEETTELDRFPSDASVGTEIRDYLQLDDQIIEVDLTPNRGDCLSVEGVAREVGVINRMPIHAPEIPEIAVTSDQTFPVEVKNSEACPCYLGRVIEGIDSNAKTPMWMQEKLRRGGMRSLGPLVDVTNYVLLELGQPMHAFDLAQLNGKVVVRNAQPNEKMVLLDGKEIELNSDTLVIADANNPVALAGIMGGEQSGIQEGTKDLFLECAFFNPLAIVGKARDYGMHTDSSHRFERGVDPQLQHRAMARATQLLLEIVGGKAGVLTEVVGEAKLPTRKPIVLRRERVGRVLGLSNEQLNQAGVEEILTGLGMTLNVDDENNPQNYTAYPPSWRFDLSIEADLIEEIGRIYGYDQLPNTRSQLGVEIRQTPEEIIPVQQIRQMLVDQGYHEVITYSFVDPEWQKMLDPAHEALALQNTISNDLSVMRTSLWPGLLQAVAFNLKRQQSRVRLFESGLRFVLDKSAEGNLRQEPVIAGVICGDVEAEQWGDAPRAVDFYDLKGDLQPLLEPLNQADQTVQFVAVGAETHPALHPGKSAKVMIGEEMIGWMGAIHPGLIAKLSLPKNLYLFEFDLTRLQQGSVPKFRELSKFPMIRRDLALLVEEKIPADALIQTIHETVREDLLQEVRLFDLYQGEPLEAGQKSVALGIFLQEMEKTLTDEEVDSVVGSVVEALKVNHAAQLRD